MRIPHSLRSDVAGVQGLVVKVGSGPAVADWTFSPRLRAHERFTIESLEVHLVLAVVGSGAIYLPESPNAYLKLIDGPRVAIPLDLLDVPGAGVISDGVCAIYTGQLQPPNPIDLWTNRITLEVSSDTTDTTQTDTFNLGILGDRTALGPPGFFGGTAPGRGSWIDLYGTLAIGRD